MSECRPVPTAIIKEGDESKKLPSGDYMKKFPYRQAVGALMYPMTGSRPDIAYAVGVLLRTLDNPTGEDWTRAKRVFRYLQGTKDFPIIYKSGLKKGVLETYSDAEHGGDLTTGRSTSGVF